MTSTTWTCRMALIEEANVPVEHMTLTVGQVFLVNCEGPAVEWSEDAAQKLKIELPKENAFALQLLKVKSLTSEKVSAEVTSYRVGDLPTIPLVLSDGEPKVILTGLNWKTESILKAETEEPPTPFPPFGPFENQYYLKLAALSLGGLLLVLAILSYFIWRRVKKKKFIERLKKLDRGLSPLHNLQRELRQLGRQVSFEERGVTIRLEMIQQLDQVFRQFVMTEFRFEAEQGSPDQISRRLKKINWRWHRKVGPLLYSSLREIERAKSRPEVSTEDFEQLIAICRKAGEELEQVKAEGRKSL